jgi:hypothetical protein
MKQYLTSLYLLLLFQWLMPAVNQAQTRTSSAIVATKTFENGIQMKIKGFTVKEAALYLDDESKLPADNKVELNQRINLQIVIEKGWTEVEERVYPGGSQIIKLSDGYEVLKSADLFVSYDETGVTKEDARYITLNAIITNIKNKKNAVMVSFKLWDKKGSSEITGTYKFYIK